MRMKREVVVGSVPAPFVASKVSENSIDRISVLGGYYIKDNEVEKVSATPLTVGTYVYARCFHSSAANLNSESAFSILVSETELEPVTFDSENQYIEYSNTLIAKVPSESEALQQYKYGNANLVLSFYNGYIFYSPIFEGGRI